jgi:hypothetical protein
MTFKISKKFGPYRYPVTVEAVTADGTRVKNPYVVIFKRLQREELDVLVRRMANGDISDAEVLRTVVIGWDKVTDEETGEKVEFSEAALEEAMTDHTFSRDTAFAFLESVGRGRGKN